MGSKPSVGERQENVHVGGKGGGMSRGKKWRWGVQFEDRDVSSISIIIIVIMGRVLGGRWVRGCCCCCCCCCWGVEIGVLLPAVGWRGLCG